MEAKEDREISTTGSSRGRNARKVLGRVSSLMRMSSMLSPLVSDRPLTISGLGSIHSFSVHLRSSSQVPKKPIRAITKPQTMVRPRSASNIRAMARMPGVGGTRPWVRNRPRPVKEAMVDMEMCLRLESMEAMGAVRTMVMSPNTGMDMMKAVRDGASSMFLPWKSLMKKLAMDLAAPVSSMAMEMMAPRMMVIPTLPRVPPKPLLIISAVPDTP